MSSRPSRTFTFASSVAALRKYVSAGIFRAWKSTVLPFHILSFTRSITPLPKTRNSARGTTFAASSAEVAVFFANGSAMCAPCRTLLGPRPLRHEIAEMDEVEDREDEARGEPQERPPARHDLQLHRRVVALPEVREGEQGVLPAVLSPETDAGLDLGLRL